MLYINIRPTTSSATQTATYLISIDIQKKKSKVKNEQPNDE